MSKFKRSSNELQAVLTDAHAMHAAIQAPNIADAEVEAIAAKAQILKERYHDISTAVGELVKLASETDPDRVVFGEAMIRKVNLLATQLIAVKEAVDQAINDVHEKLQPILDKRAEEAQSMDRQKQQERKRIEQERETARKIESAKIAALEAEKKRKAEAEAARAAVEHEEERKRFEEERGVRRIAQAADAERQAFLDQRLKQAESMDIAEVLDIIELTCSPKQLRCAVGALLDIVGNIISSPEDPTFRNIRKANEKLNGDLLSVDGGLEALICIGFREKNPTQTINEAHFYIAEPPVDNFDEWSSWYDKLQKNRALLQSVYDGLS
uniref:PUB domain-containing protein n=1 Tax=Spongospora subterranea TaxID=70186 RepID=A0A0H5RB26_9EUKA|eukprot:CRZ11243.1 hypothetical protein [Spongospora subterranea]